MSSLALDEIDEVLYLVRVNEAEELQTYLSSLAKQYNETTASVIVKSIDPQSGNSVLHFCAANGFSDLMQKLLRDVTSQDCSENAATTTAFVNHQNAEGNTALHWGALNGHLSVVKLLVEAKADMWIKNAAGHLAMFEAERAKEENEVVQFLLEAGGKEVEHTGNDEQFDAGDEDEITMSAGVTQADTVTTQDRG